MLEPRLLNSASILKASNTMARLILAVGRPTLAISPQNSTRNDLRRSEIKNFPGEACPQTPLLGVLRALYYTPPSIAISQVHAGTPLFKILDPPLCGMGYLSGMVSLFNAQ